MNEERKKRKKDKNKIIVAFTIDPEIYDWVKEWAVKHDRSVSWAVNYFCKERREREMAEKELGGVEI
jgi:hypothetical protein